MATFSFCCLLLYSSLQATTAHVDRICISHCDSAGRIAHHRYFSRPAKREYGWTWGRGGEPLPRRHHAALEKEQPRCTWKLRISTTSTKRLLGYTDDTPPCFSILWTGFGGRGASAAAHNRFIVMHLHSKAVERRNQAAFNCSDIKQVSPILHYLKQSRCKPIIHVAPKPLKKKKRLDEQPWRSTVSTIGSTMSTHGTWALLAHVTSKSERMVSAWFRLIFLLKDKLDENQTIGPDWTHEQQ